jgi:hypothetical protein
MVEEVICAIIGVSSLPVVHNFADVLSCLVS